MRHYVILDLQNIRVKQYFSLLCFEGTYVLLCDVQRQAADHDGVVPRHRAPVLRLAAGRLGAEPPGPGTPVTVPRPPRRPAAALSARLSVVLLRVPPPAPAPAPVPPPPPVPGLRLLRPGAGPGPLPAVSPLAAPVPPPPLLVPLLPLPRGLQVLAAVLGRGRGGRQLAGRGGAAPGVGRGQRHQLRPRRGLRHHQRAGRQQHRAAGSAAFNLGLLIVWYNIQLDSTKTPRFAAADSVDVDVVFHEIVFTCSCGHGGTGVVLGGRRGAGLGRGVLLGREQQVGVHPLPQVLAVPSTSAGTILK